MNLEMLHKEGVNLDHISVGWQLPGESGLCRAKSCRAARLAASTTAQVARAPSKMAQSPAGSGPATPTETHILKQ